MISTATDLVSVRRYISARPAYYRPTAKVGRMILTPEGSSGTALALPYAPQEVEHEGLGAEFVNIPRPGLKPLWLFSNEQTPQMSMTLTIVDKKSYGFSNGVMVTTAISVIQRLRAMAKSGQRIRVTYGLMESGVWNITDFSVKSMRRHPMTDEIMQATADIALVRADSGPAVGVGPITGGPTPPRPPVQPPSKPPTKVTARYHTMRKGDTLWSVSIKYYKTPNKWKYLADINKIKDVRKIPINKKIRVP